MTNAAGDAADRLSHSGRWTVVAMLSFGILAVASLAIYWEVYTRPFRDLQYAIVAEYPRSLPQVIGGRHQSHKEGSALTLRIVVRVPLEDFNPETETERSEELARHLFLIASRHHPVAEYEQVEIRLTQPVPEQDLRRWSVSRSPDEWRSLLEAFPSTASSGKYENRP